MIGHTGDVILRLVAWTFLPDFITKRLVDVWTRLPMNRGKPRPQQGDQIYRYTFALVVAAYLAYNIFQASVSTPLNYYQILGVPITADENELKSAFRNFARKNHPDRAGPGAESLFIAVRDAYDGLRQPVKRFAYDRFGPDIFAWDTCSTPRDFVASGLLASSGFYIGSSFFMMVFYFFGSSDSGAFWRYALFLGLLVSELALVLGPSHTQLEGHPNGSTPHTGNWLLTSLFPNRIPHQHVLYLHQLFLSVSIAISRIVPALHPIPVDGQKLRADILVPMAQRLSELARGVQAESSRMMVSELRVLHVASGAVARNDDFTPKRLSSTVLGRLRAGLEELIVDRSLRSHPPVRTAWEAAVVKARTEELDEADEIDAGEEMEREAEPEADGDARVRMGMLSPPSSEQPESPRVREANELEHARQLESEGRARSFPAFKRGAFADLKSDLGLRFPGTPGAGLRRSSF
ncbi:hypothetical protein BKA62DRAFT_703471 [Auriculariales sp. MPI-PUGE-AT-0066]|nr:hypothetical protein BKA62DRAFT_703471 [Auriculariales sp. MPI-PUGE-AT-0066]